MRATGDCFHMIKVAETVGLPIYSLGARGKTVLAQGQGQGRKSPVKAKRLKKKKGGLCHSFGGGGGGREQEGGRIKL